MRITTAFDGHHRALNIAGLLNRLLPDVWVHTDHNAGRTGGESPGFALSLVAESTTGVLMVAETAAEKVGWSPHAGHRHGQNTGRRLLFYVKLSFAQK